MPASLSVIRRSKRDPQPWVEWQNPSHGLTGTGRLCSVNVARSGWGRGASAEAQGCDDCDVCLFSPSAAAGYARGCTGYGRHVCHRVLRLRTVPVSSGLAGKNGRRRRGDLTCCLMTAGVSGPGCAMGLHRCGSGVSRMSGASRRRVHPPCRVLPPSLTFSSYTYFLLSLARGWQGTRRGVGSRESSSRDVSKCLNV